MTDYNLVSLFTALLILCSIGIISPVLGDGALLSDAKYPKYEIIDMELTFTNSWVTLDQNLTTTLTLKNQGAEDTNPEFIPVSAWLGKEALIPIDANITPLKAGEKKSFPLTFNVPNTTTPVASKLIIRLDPGQTRVDTDYGKNEITSVTYITVEEPETDYRNIFIKTEGPVFNDLGPMWKE